MANLRHDTNCDLQAVWPLFIYSPTDKPETSTVSDYSIGINTAEIFQIFIAIFMWGCTKNLNFVRTPLYLPKFSNK